MSFYPLRAFWDKEGVTEVRLSNTYIRYTIYKVQLKCADKFWARVPFTKTRRKLSQQHVSGNISFVKECCTCLMVLRHILAVLCEMFSVKPIMTDGNVAEVPLHDLRSRTDLIPLHFYVWGNMETLVSAAPVENEERLHHCSVDACQTVIVYPDISERIRRSMTRRVE
jgi:hypothetical protein